MIINKIFYFSIEDILADSDDDDVYNDSSDEMMEDIDDNLINEAPKSKKVQIKKLSTKAHIRENPEEIVDLADMRMIGNVISKFIEYDIDYSFL